MNRFMLNLRSLDQPDDTNFGGRGTAHSMGFSTPRFVAHDSFLGNIGESLESQFIDEDIAFDEDDEARAVETDQVCAHDHLEECIAGPSTSRAEP